jgi:hypothetical protein
MRQATLSVALLALATAPAAESSWPPSGSNPQRIAAEVADHVAPQYRYAGEPVVKVIADTPHVVKAGRTFVVKRVALMKNDSTPRPLAIFDTTDQQDYILCGAGPHCTIPGKASLSRFRLVERVVLELARDTFTYSTTIQSIVVYAPPTPGKSKGGLFYLRRTQLPQPHDPETLTKHFYAYESTGLQGGGLGLLLFP